MEPTDHIHISEREPDGSWEDCTWDSGLEWYRLVYDARKPATHAEAQLLRRASGEPSTGGSNITDLKRGIKARYGTSAPVAVAARTWRSTVTRGKVAVLQGSMKAFGPDHPLSKWDRNFDGAHAIVLIHCPSGHLHWCDPEAPRTADVPVIVTAATVDKFVNAFAGQALVGTVCNWPTPPPPPAGDTVEPIVKYLPGYTAAVKPQSNVRNLPRITTTSKVYTVDATKDPIVLIGTVKGDPDPGNANSTEWYCWWDTTRKLYLYTAAENVVDLKAPAQPVDCAPAIKAAVDKAKADAVVEKDAAVAAAKVEATEAEQARIAGVLGL